MSNTRYCPFCRTWVVLPFRDTIRAFDRHKKECDPEGFARQIEFSKELLGGPDLMEETDILEQEPIIAENIDSLGKPPKTPKAPKATVAKEPKPAKPAKEPKPSKFPGTYAQTDAVNAVNAAIAAEKPLGKSRTFTVTVGEHVVAPKWLVTEMTGIASSEFKTEDAVRFLDTLGLKCEKHG